MAPARPQPHKPVRTCVGCRARTVDSELLRVVAVDGIAVPDPRRRHPGRGAWIHPRPECLALAERRRAFPRALRVPGPLALGSLAAWVKHPQDPPAGAEEAGK